jgi:hypothetical protein
VARWGARAAESRSPAAWKRARPAAACQPAAEWRSLECPVTPVEPVALGREQPVEWPDVRTAETASLLARREQGVPERQAAALSAALWTAVWVLPRRPGAVIARSREYLPTNRAVTATAAAALPSWRWASGPDERGPLAPRAASGSQCLVLGPWVARVPASASASQSLLEARGAGAAAAWPRPAALPAPAERVRWCLRSGERRRANRAHQFSRGQPARRRTVASLTADSAVLLRGLVSSSRPRALAPAETLRPSWPAPSPLDCRPRARPGPARRAGHSSPVSSIPPR